MSYIDSSSYSCFISYPSYPQMQNGCICCTLRGDLLKTVKSLAQEGDFDYLVIEVCMSFALLCMIVFTGNWKAVAYSGTFMALGAAWGWRYPSTPEEYDRRKKAGEKIGLFK